jgi:hypothetical protein
MDFLPLDLELYPPPHPATIADEELLKQCIFGKGRSSGPGGQHRNKVETKVILTHKPTSIIAHAGERRSAIENKRVAIKRLRLALATSVRCAVPKGDARSPLWISRIDGEGHIVVNPRHRDYPALLAEALDMLASAKWEPDSAAVRLGCSMSQLVKLVKEHPPAFNMWNRARAKRGKHALK